MLPEHASATPRGDDDRAERRRRHLERLRAAAGPILEEMADALSDAPDRELFRSLELRLRDLGRRIAASAQQAGLDDRKKGGTSAPAPSARTAAATPAASITAATPSSPSTAP
jgi:hypothetical protein